MKNCQREKVKKESVREREKLMKLSVKVTLAIRGFSICCHEKRMKCNVKEGKREI